MTVAPALGLRAELYSASTGLPLNAGNLEKVLGTPSPTYGGALGKIGAFQIAVPAEDVNSQTVGYEQEIRIYREGEGLVFRGLVRHLETLVDPDGSTKLVISGPGIEAQLAKLTTRNGLTLDAASLSSCVSSLLALASGWSAGTLDSVSTAYTKLVRAPLWPALADVADVLGCYLRADNLNKEIDIGAFGTNPNGIEFRNFEEITQGLQDNPRLFELKRISIVGDSASVVTRMIPFGQGTGLNNSNFDISLATVTTPYAMQSDTDPDGNAEYYIVDAAAEALYGRSEVVRLYKGISPLGLTATDFQRAANQLIQAAGVDLARESKVLSSYSIDVQGLKHIINGQPTFQVGDTFHVVYNGIVTDLTGKRRWLAVDANLYVMDYTRTFAPDGSDQWRFTVNTVPRLIPDDGNVTRALLDSIQAVETAPSPYILLNPGIRVDQLGMQLIVPDTGYSIATYFTPAFLTSAADVFGNHPQGVLQASYFSAVPAFQQFLIAFLHRGDASEISAYVSAEAWGDHAMAKLSANFDGDAYAPYLKVIDDADPRIVWSINGGPSVGGTEFRLGAGGAWIDFPF